LGTSQGGALEPEILKYLITPKRVNKNKKNNIFFEEPRRGSI